MNPYAYMVKIRLLLSMSYRFGFFARLAVQIVLLLTSAVLWRAAFRNLDTVAQVDERQMLVYSVMSIVLGSVFAVSVESTIRGKVRQGNVAVDYIKPVNVFLMYLSEDLGESVTSLLQTGLPVMICAWIFITPPLPASPLHFLLFLVSCCLSYAILWLISAIFGLFYFKVIDMGPLGNIKDYIIKILSGSFVPLWFFPQPMQQVLKFLPFIYTYQHPLSIYIGRSTPAQALEGMLIQALWTALFLLLFLKLKKGTETGMFVQGG